MQKLSESAVLLSVNPLFAKLGNETLEQLGTLCRRRKYSAGEILFQKGDPGDALYGIRRGLIRIETGTAAGEKLTLNLLGPGDLFGEIALLDGQERTAGAVAAEKSELYSLRRSDFLSFIERHPEVAIRVMELLCERMRWMSERMEETAFLPVHVRIARRLVALANDFGAEVQITQGQLSEYVNAARETVSRQLQQWRREKIVGLGRGKIIILNGQKLQALSVAD